MPRCKKSSGSVKELITVLGIIRFFFKHSDGRDESAFSPTRRDVTLPAVREKR